MSKPYGMTIDMRIMKPSRVEDKIWDAVEEALSAGWTPKQFRTECEQSWLHWIDDAHTESKREAIQAWGAKA